MAGVGLVNQNEAACGSLISPLFFWLHPLLAKNRRVHPFLAISLVMIHTSIKNIIIMMMIIIVTTSIPYCYCCLEYTAGALEPV